MPQPSDQPRAPDRAPTPAPAQSPGRPATVPPKKKGLLEWIMLAVGLSYGDEGEDKWTKRREAAAAPQQPQSSPTEPRP